MGHDSARDLVRYLGVIEEIVAYLESELERGAIVALRNIKTRLDSYLKRTLATDTRLVFRDFEKNYGSVQLDRSRLEIYLHMTVEPK